MIELDGVRFGYRDGRDIVDVDRLTIPPGLTLLVGPNGAGKSTLLRLLAGVEHPQHGSITVCGFDLWKQEVAARRKLAYFPERTEVTPLATIEELLRLVCRLRDVETTHVARVLERVGLLAEARSNVRQLSQGQRRRVLLAAALIGDPEVLLLDEPFEGLDRGMREQVQDWILTSASSGKTVIVATHELAGLPASAGAVMSVRQAKVLLDRLPQDLEQRDAILDRLLRPD